MIFSWFKDKKDDKKKAKKEPRDDLVDEKEDVLDTDVEDEISALSKTSIDVDVKEQSVKLSKQIKKNIYLNKTNRKTRSNRISHTKKDYSDKSKKNIKDLVRVHDIVKRPIISEKAADKSEKNVYTFLVDSKANKYDISKAIEVLYNVKPKKVRVVSTKTRSKRIRVPGREREFSKPKNQKKAYIFLNKNDKIKIT